ncbi:MAG: VCBS repeat-containing protein [Candidatus Rokubacteria bacterium]|nr:VCBS repeat-containing protein [Candidatus Rokubacteria bacterium]
MARAVVLWSEGTLRPGDQLVWPPRFTILLLPTEAEDSPELAGLARHLDRWLELELLTDRRLRVVRADQPAEERWRLKRFQEEREYTLVVAPLLVSEPDGVQVVLRVRSMFTGQTLARRQAGWKTVAAASSVPPTQAAPERLTPYAAGIRPVQPPAAIKRAERSPDRMSVELRHSLKAIALGDVDGDGRIELVGITDRQAIVFRWTGQGVTPLAMDDPLADVFTTYIHVDAGDVNGNGKADVALTAIRSVPRGNRIENELNSVVAEVRQGRLEYLAKGFERYLRILQVPGKPPILLAQAMGFFEPFAGPVEVVEWKDARYQPGARFPLPRGVSSVYAFGSGDLDGGGHAQLALVTPDGRFEVYDREGQRLWESEEDIGQVTWRGFAQTPRFPNYSGLGFDAIAVQLAVWRTVPRRVLVTPVPATTPDIVTVGNPETLGLRVSFTKKEDQSVRGRAVGYGWDAQARQFAKRWESAEFAGRVLDFAVGDLGGDGRIKLVVLSGIGERRFLDVFTLYDTPRAKSNGGSPAQGARKERP